MAANTRTSFTTALVRFLAWTLPDHSKHHGLAAVPIHQVPDLQSKMPGAVQVTAAGSAAFTKAHLGWRL